MTDQRINTGDAGDTVNAEGLITREQFRRLADLVLKTSEGDQTFISLHDASGGTTRFANNQIVQNVNTHRVSLAVTVAFGRKQGTATATDFGEDAIRDMVRRATEIARVSPEDPEYMKPLPPQDYVPLDTMQQDTALAGPEKRIAYAAEAIQQCQAGGFTAAGIVASSVAAVGLAAKTGLFAYEPRTEAKFSITAMGGEATGWAANVHRSIDTLGIPARTRFAIQKAKQAANPREIPPGRYTVILEPSAIACLIGPMIWTMDAKSFYKRTSPYEGKLGRLIMDRRLTLSNQTRHPDLLGNGFNSEGLPAEDLVWIQNGVLKQLRYDRYTAQEHHVHPSPSFDAPYLLGTPLGQVLAATEAAGAGHSAYPSLEDLIRSTPRGILVTNFWYIRDVNPTDMTLTGMTRDGIFLIEDGHITTPLVNFRWHESPFRAFNNVEAFTAPIDAVSNENWKMQLPAMKITDFNFSSVTRF
jgi:predicted Zn-dependent protease